MIIGIDASNISQGGGVVHLKNIINYAEKSESVRFLIWCSKKVEREFVGSSNIEIINSDWIEGSFFKRFFCQQFLLPKEIREKKCDFLLSPGGIVPFFGVDRCVVISQNILPFELSESLKFGFFSVFFWKMIFLRYVQIFSFLRCDGIIYLSEYAKKIINEIVDLKSKASAVIPHGIEDRFRAPPREQKDYEYYSTKRKFSLLYVSVLMPYKNHENVINAFRILGDRGINVEVKFVGPDFNCRSDKIKKMIFEMTGNYCNVSFLGAVNFEKLHEFYKEADGFLFASTCENLPNILIEAMSAGLPIACADKGPMSDILSDAGFYFDASSPYSIAENIEIMVKSKELRSSKSEISYKLSNNFSWERCSRDTFKFIEKNFEEKND